jgi:Mg2+-importing ATPase
VKCVDPNGVESEEVLRFAYLNSIFHTARKSPLDTAIQEHGKMETHAFVKVDEIPFDFERRRDSLVLRNGEELIMVTKGAPESVIEVATSVSGAPMTDALRITLRATYDQLSSDGFRVLAVATKALPDDARVSYRSDEEREMVFIGFAAFLDPPKQSVVETLEELKALHVSVKILTGDSEVLTERICRDIGLPVTGMLTGAQIAQMSDEALLLRVGEVNVFARVSPEQKERIVVLLRKAGNVVGYLGDGINDAPVLKAADVGISVNNAVDVAKETADIILLSKSLGVLKDGIVQGRKTFLNTIKYIKMGFSSNFGNMFSMMGASAVLPFLPMLPTQILLNNFLYDLSQTTLPSDHIDEETTKNPIAWDMSGFSRYIIVFGIASSVFDFFMFYLLYAVFDMKDSAFQTGWFIESIATQVLIIFVIRTKRVPFFRSMPSVYIMMNAAFIVGLAWALPFTVVGSWLHLVPLPLPILGAIAGVVVVYLLFGEFVKYFFYRWRPSAP